MRDLILFFPEKVNLKDIYEKYSENEFHKSNIDGEVFIAEKSGGHNDFMQFCEDYEPELVYESDELKFVEDNLSSYRAFLCHYRDVSAAVRILRHLLKGGNGIIDNDYGDLMTFNDFLERVDTDFCWDWLKS